MEFERGFGRLRPDERTAFVAALWAARGFKTTSGERTVVATDPATGSEICIQLLRSVENQLSRGAVSSNADVLVTDSPHVAERAEGLDVRVLDASDLRAMTLYAIDREQAEDLTRAYFDQPVSMLMPTDDSTNGDNQTSGQTVSQSSLLDGPIGFSPDPTVRTGLVLFLATVLLVGLVFGVTTGGPSHENGAGWTIGGGPPFQGTSVAVTRYPPGIGPGGVNNLPQLVRTHQKIVEARPHYLVVRHNGSRGQVVTNARWIASQQTVYVGRDRSYFGVVGTIPPETVGDSPQQLSFVAYRTGTTCNRGTSAAVESDRGTSAGCAVLEEGEVAERFAQVAGTYLRRYLDTTTSTVQVVRAGKGYRYQVTATGNPHRISADVTGYRADATVNRSGFVTSLRVEYTWQRPDGPRRIQFELQYTDVNDGST